ncbi:MAG: DUF2335 domain-containing protein [Thermodesulfobacteriota bacterium]
MPPISDKPSEEDAPVPCDAQKKTPVEPERVVEELKSLPPKVQQTIFAQFIGPLPPPEVFAGYDNVLPGAAERILKMAEDEANHRRAQEGRIVASSCQDGRLGLWMGFVIGMLGISGSCVVAIIGNALAGSVLGIASIAALAGVFVYGSRQRGPQLPPASDSEES